MNCEEFELRGLGLDRADADEQESAAAVEHTEVCGRCSSLLESWREVKADLRLLGETTRTGAAPARIEMRLKQELRTRRAARVPRSALSVAGWALAAAAVLVASIGWIGTKNRVANPMQAETGATQDTNQPLVTAGTSESGMLLAADYDSGEFTQLPGSLPSESGEQEILQVGMQRGMLGRFGLPVEPERVAEWVRVDFLVGEDGQPQAVRLHQDAQVTAVTQ